MLLGVVLLTVLWGIRSRMQLLLCCYAHAMHGRFTFCEEAIMNTGHDANWSCLTEFAGEQIKKQGIPGAVVGILHKGETATAGFGVTNVEHQLPVTDETLFQIGSITKTFTGAAIMRLVEMGKVDLDTTIKTYLPDFKVADQEATNRATVRHLLTHTAGWVGDFFIDSGPGDDAVAAYVSRMADLEQLAPTGTVYSYNNAGFSVAGRIIETVMGVGYYTAMQELIFESLKLENVYFQAGDVISRRFAVGHNIAESGAEVARPWPLPRGLHPAGGIICDVHTLLRYAAFHLGDGMVDKDTRLLEADSLTQMQSPQVTIWGGEKRGLSWGIDDTCGVRQLSHGGGTVGQMTLLNLVPEHDFAIAVFTNANRGGALTSKINRWALKQYIGIDSADPTRAEADVKELEQYVGSYSRPHTDIDLGMVGKKLIGKVTIKGGFPTQDAPPQPSPPPATFDLCEKDRLLALDGPAKGSVIDVVRKPDGSIGWLRAGGRIHVRQT